MPLNPDAHILPFSFLVPADRSPLHRHLQLRRRRLRHRDRPRQEEQHPQVRGRQDGRIPLKEEGN